MGVGGGGRGGWGKQWEGGGGGGGGGGEEEYGKLKSDLVVWNHGGSLVVIRGGC